MAEKKITKTEKKETKKVEVKIDDKKEDSKIIELKIELLKQGSKKRDIKREIARLLTLQNKNMGDKK
jgi:hypothetical protein